MNGIRRRWGMRREFVYYPGDFGELPVRVLHMDLAFDVWDDHTVVDSRMMVEVGENSLQSLALNARDLEIHEVSADAGSLSWRYERDKAMLIIDFHAPLRVNSRVTIHTRSTCRPSYTLLEGLYYDWTPQGAPPTQITQCQQWGFQRLVPCFDDMTAKCTYNTTIIADRRYSHIISNGDVVEERKPAGQGRDSIRYANVLTPMAPYLFFLGVGTYASFQREFEYPDGHRFILEILVPPGSDPVIASHALEILADAVLWVYLFTGPDQFQKTDLRMDLWHIVKERDLLIKSGTDSARLEAIRRRLLDLVYQITPGYAYTGSVYREIGMQNSDFGGMENVGNTTISTNRIMPFLQMIDGGFEYMVAVKVHEFYHNLNGSEVTGKSPFEIWLNEAVTVCVEEHNHSFLFGSDYSRLRTVLTFLSPEGGTFALDQGTASMPIEPDGFNDPNELITGVTYVKAPEYVRMVAMLMGKELFAQGLHRYHARYRHGNASSQDWIGAMEDASGQYFSGMAQSWLKKTGFPILEVHSSYDPLIKTLSLDLFQESSQGDDTVWEFPFAYALVDEEGNEIHRDVKRICSKRESFSISGVDEPAFLSLNTGYSFYGKVKHRSDSESLFLAARVDPDAVNRFMAWYAIVDEEKLGLLSGSCHEPSTQFVDLFYELLSDESYMGRVGAQALTIFESVEDPQYAHMYRELYDAKTKLLVAVAHRYGDGLLRLYHKYDNPIPPGDYLATKVRKIRNRQVKNLILSVLATLDDPAVHALIKGQFERSGPATDRLVAFSLYMNSSAPDRMDILEHYQKEAGSHPVSWETFLSVVAANSSDDAASLVRDLASHPGFHIDQANEQRALIGRFAMNRKVSLQTEEGRRLVSDFLIRLAPINEYSTVRALSAFSALDMMEEQYRAEGLAILVNLLDSLDRKRSPSVYNTTLRMLQNSPLSKKAYENQYGPIPRHYAVDFVSRN